MSAFTDSVRGWLNAGLGLLYPEVCQLCGEARATPAEGYVCGGCRAKARFIQAAVLRAVRPALRRGHHHPV